MKTAGVVFDFYDDLAGSLLKAAFPTPDSLPEVIKTAHILSPEERNVLRDEAFALIMINDGQVLRKFACVDPGNTLLSALYFVENRDLLPEEAQKVASANILAACEEFDLPIDPLVKEAFVDIVGDLAMAHYIGKKAKKTKEEDRKALAKEIATAVGKKKTAAKTAPQRTRDPMKTPYVGDEADWAQRTNLTSIQGSKDEGRVLSSTAQMKTAHVDVSSFKPVPKLEKKAHKHTALGRYPLDSYADVQRAMEYFQETHTEFSPKDRHEFCVKTASRAEELGMTVPEMVGRYGSTEYSPDVDAHLAHRRSMSNEEFHSLFDALQEKRAHIEPEQFAQLLSEADEVAGLHWLYPQVSDPYFATFGGNLQRDKLASWGWTSSDGVRAVDAVQLQELAENLRGVIEETFSKDAADAFAKDPVAIFESMPDPQKEILARLATES